MALAESTVQDKIEVVDCGGWKVIQVRTATIITKDGTEISRSFHRHLLNPTDDFSGESEDVKAMATRFFTDEAKAAYTAAQSEAP
jgi:hypothetical protein